MTLALAALFAVSTAALAQSYPAKPPTIIVPFAFGTPIDMAARTAAAALQARLERTILVENRPGIDGISTVANAPADGYTLLTVGMQATVAPKLDLSRHFSAVGQVVAMDLVLVAHRSMAARNVPELVAALKAEPGRYRFGSEGDATPTYLAAELFKRETHVDAQHVAYQHLPLAVGDASLGRLQFMFAPSARALPHIKSGALRALAVTGAKRLEVLKDTPTMVEAGFPGFIVSDWVGFAVRAGTPAAIVERLNGELKRGLADPDVRTQLARMGAEVATGTPRAFDELIAAEAKRWEKLAPKR